MRPRNLRIHLVATLLSGLLLSACGDDITFPPVFDDSLGIDLATMTKTSSGLYYLDMVVGSGVVTAAGDSATVVYTGWLPSGTSFDSGSFGFTVGVGRVIPGFDEGVEGMRVGGKRKLVIRPELGYGKQGSGAIPPNSTLIFEVDVTKLTQR
ncbi:MAG: FKBP-type peptidyl-prolyl cis-trans isomerase [Longimicrobiales bacterium]